MQAKFDVDLTKADYVSGLTTVIVQLALTDPRRNHRIWEQLGVMAILFIGLALAFPRNGLAVLVSFLVAILANSWLISRNARQTSGASYDPATASFVAEIDDDGLRDRTASRERNWRWAAVRQVHDNGTVVVLQLAGWDMLILPHRLWSSAVDRTAFLEAARARIAGPAAPELAAPPTLKDLMGRDQLFIGAIAAGIDAMFVATIFVPAAYEPTGIWVTIGGLLLAAGVGYLAYRIARLWLPRLHATAPNAARWLSRLLVLMLPIYMVAGFFGLVAF